MNEIINRIRADQEDLLENLEKIRQANDVLPDLETIKQTQEEILEIIKEIQDGKNKPEI